MDTCPKPIKLVSCGCCTNGCVCWNHQDTPRGLPPQVCTVHDVPGHPAHPVTCQRACCRQEVATS